ncbi:MAG TPA: nucleotide sugar dehydrogenase [Ignavibacteriaceae bacterium]|nr:nucleotide sugar dehydrogenase [Ignavibacteriaceae bacterium]
MEIIKKINNKTARIGIIGLGYVGLPLGLEFASKGYDVTGFDVDEKKIPILNSGKSYIKHIMGDRIKRFVDSKKFSATSDFSKLTKCDAIIICVPTPLNEHREPDMTYIENSGKIVAQYLRKGQLVVLESSTYPGTTEEILLSMFQTPTNSPFAKGGEKKRGFKVGVDFYLAFSPEREDPNNPDFSTGTIPKVVGGVTENCLKAALALYNQVIVKTVPVSSTRAAEATKLVENIYRSVNIALVNELKVVFDRMNIDVWEVIEAAATKPFGFHPFYPGPGLGGHCIPIDPFYLTWKAREFEVHTRFIELAGEINTSMPYYVVEKAGEALNKTKRSLNGAKVLILGASYKKDIDDMRESPSLRLIELLREKGAKVDYNDPYVVKLPRTRKYDYHMKSVPLTAPNLKKYDLILLSTDHTYYKENSKLIIQNSKLVVDTRNLFGKAGVKSSKIFKA